MQSIRQSKDEFLFVSVMLVEDVMIEPARRENANESLVGVACGL
jgi:hypothetical protein